MIAAQQPWVELYAALRDHEGVDAWTDVLAPWLAAHPDEVAWIADFARRTADDWKRATEDDLNVLYALSRTTSLLLLRFQPGERDPNGPAVTVDGFRRFHEALGFRVAETAGFHPFFHEITHVEQTDDDDAPVEVARELWPALMLGEMMFSRAGCVARGGRVNVAKEIAEASTLYWAFRRNDRRCEDASHGWGSNSQWRTRFRRDYRSPRGFHYNVDGQVALDGVEKPIDGVPAEVLREIVRHRCLVRSAVADTDGLYPYPYSMIDPRA